MMCQTTYPASQSQTSHFQFHNVCQTGWLRVAWVLRILKILRAM